jgi:hypothetical protein
VESFFETLIYLHYTDTANYRYWLAGATHDAHAEDARVRRLPDLSAKKIGLFTTYMVATGSMFRGMRRHLRCTPADVRLALKSRDGKLSESHRSALDHHLRD